MKLSRERAGEFALEFVNKGKNKNYNLTLLSVEISKISTNYWAATFEVSTTDGHIIDGPLLILVDDDLEKAMSLDEAVEEGTHFQSFSVPMNTIKASLKQSYNNQAPLRDSIELEAWKIEERDSVLHTFQANQVQRVLEIGAGPGRDGLYLKQHGLDMIVIDMSEEMVRLCQNKGLHARLMDFYELKFDDQSFDAVYAMNCLLHVPKAQLPDVLAEIQRVLKPDKIEEIVNAYFKVEDLHTRNMGEGKPHFQAMILRK